MENSLSVRPVGNNLSRVSLKESSFNDRVFQDSRKSVKKSEVRDADWGLYAAQTCLAKALVTASPEESKLIAQKMNFIQNIINQNMEQDQDIYSREMNDKGKLIIIKADAKSKTLPLKTDFIRTSAAGVVDVANTSVKLMKEVKTPKLDIVQ